MLSEISQTQTDKYCITSLICGILKSQTHTKREQNGTCWALRVGGMEDAGQMVQTFSYKMNKFWIPNVQYGDYS